MVALLERDNGAMLDATLRDHARSAAGNAFDYTYWRSSPDSGELYARNGKYTLAYALEDEAWDIVVLQQGGEAAGFTASYNSDLEYLIDLAQDLSPGADLYWNMTWACSNALTDKSSVHGAAFNKHYWQSQENMYNAIVTALRDNITSGGKFAAKFTKVIPTGAAVQNVSAPAPAGLGDIVYRDSVHLGQKGGRLLAALTALETIYPAADLSGITAEALADILQDEDGAYPDPYQNTDNNLTLLKTAAATACSDPPQKVNAPAEEVHPTATLLDQVEAPLRLHFPDIAALSDGTVIAAAYEHIAHTPVIGLGQMQEGAGKIVQYTSHDNGANWSKKTVVDEARLEEWGITELSGRYARLKAAPNSTYEVLADARDPNLVSGFIDMDGDGTKEEVLLFTFWVAYFNSEGRRYLIETFLCHSTDKGETWSKPQMIVARPKRGDIAIFKDGSRQILVPWYTGNTSAALLLEWNTANQTWVEIRTTYIPNVMPERTSVHDEAAFVSPDGDTVFVFQTVNGTVLRSDDRGESWILVGSEPEVCNHPGFTILDSGRVFATRSISGVAPRDTLGKVFYWPAGWSETEMNLIFDSHWAAYPRSNDTGDPHCTTLPDGKVMTVQYYTPTRALFTTIEDPDIDKYLPIEVRSGGATVTLSESSPNQVLGTFPLGVAPDGSYTIAADVDLAAADSFVTMQTTAGNVLFGAGGIAVPTGVSHIKVGVVGTTLFWKAWQGGTEPENWTVKEGAKASGFAISGGNATLQSVRVSRTLKIELQESCAGIAQMTELPLSYKVLPEQSDIAFTSDKPEIASVSAEGVVTMHTPGEAVITLSTGGLSKTCTVTVNPPPIELSGEGTKEIIIDDDFERYDVGVDSFWDVIQNGHNNEHNYASNSAQKESEDVYYDIELEGGNQILVLQSKDGKTPWVKIDRAIAGDYTAQFDFRFPTTTYPPHYANEYLYLNLWQDSDIYIFVHFNSANGIRFQYKEGDKYINTAYVRSDLTAQGTWRTAKLIRVNGGIFLKVWERGTPEPDEFTSTLLLPMLTTDQPATFRMQYYISRNTNALPSLTGRLSIDNLLFSRQVPETTTVAGTKIWDDADDLLQMRPESVTVQLYADGTAVEGKTLTLNAGNNWTGTFTDLPVNKNGQPIVYTVDETAVPFGYTKAITGTAADGFTITNTHWLSGWLTWASGRAGWLNNQLTGWLRWLGAVLLLYRRIRNR